MITNEIKTEVSRILGIIEWEFKIHPNSIHNKTRQRETIIARQFAHKLIREKFANTLPNLSTREIGMLVANKDHATVIHSCKVVKNLIETDIHYLNVYNHLKNAIKKRNDNLLKKELISVVGFEK